MLTPDTVLQGRDRIVRQLGQGGMGAAYEAVDERLDTLLALNASQETDPNEPLLGRGQRIPRIRRLRDGTRVMITPDGKQVVIPADPRFRRVNPKPKSP